MTSQTLHTVLPLIIPAGIIKFLPFFPAGINRGRELLELIEIYLISAPQKMHN